MSAAATRRSRGRVSALRRASARLGHAWTRTARRRRLAFLLLASPGFFGVFATPLHRNPWLLGSGAGLFAAACLVRARTEPLFVRAEAATPGLPPRSKEVTRV